MDSEVVANMLIYNNIKSNLGFTLKQLKIIHSKISKVQEAIKNSKNIEETTKYATELTKLKQEYDKLQSELVNSLKILYENNMLSEIDKNTIAEILIYMKSNDETEELITELKELSEFKFDDVKEIKFYVAKNDFEEHYDYETVSFDDIDALQSDLIAVTAYRVYYDDSEHKAYIEAVINNYTNHKLDAEVIIDRIFQSPYPIDRYYFLANNLKEVTLSELISNANKYIYIPIRLKATLLSIDAEPKAVFRTMTAKKGDEEIVIHNAFFLEKTEELLSGYKITETVNDVEAIINFELTDENANIIEAYTYADNLKKLQELAGDEIEAIGLLVMVRTSSKTAETKLKFFATDVRPATESELTLTEKEEKEIEEFINSFETKEAFLNWLIDNYGQQIKYDKKFDFVWRMKLTHLILALNTYYNNEKMLHSLILSEQGKGKSELARKYLYTVARKTEFTNLLTTSVAGLVGGLDPENKKFSIGALKRADKGILIIDEIDKNTELARELFTAIQESMESGEVNYTKVKSVKYSSRYNLLVLGNYDDQQLSEIISYATDEEDAEKQKEEFIYKTLHKVLSHSSIINRFIIIDTDVFEEQSRDEFMLKILQSEIDGETFSGNLTAEEIITLSRIRKILIYISKHYDIQQIKKTINKNMKTVYAIVKRNKMNARQSKRFVYLIALLTALQAKTEVDDYTIKLAELIVNTTKRIDKIFRQKEEEIKEFINEYIENELFAKLSFDAIKLDTIRRQFKEEAMKRLGVDAVSDAMKMFDQKLTELNIDKKINIINNEIKIGAKKVSEVIEDFLTKHYVEADAEDPATLYYRLDKLADKLKLS